jgi:hypothetical protein
VESPLRLSCGSLRRSRRRSGGNLTLGLPGSSTEQPIPWFFRGSPPFARLSRTIGGRSHRVVRSYVPNDRSSRGIPQGSAAEAPQAVVPTTAAHLPGSTTPGPWRHLATSTSDRNAVLCPWAQDGHRKPPNFRPVGSR